MFDLNVGDKVRMSDGGSGEVKEVRHFLSGDMYFIAGDFNEYGIWFCGEGRPNISGVPTIKSVVNLDLIGFHHGCEMNSKAIAVPDALHCGEREFEIVEWEAKVGSDELTTIYAKMYVRMNTENEANV